MRRIVRPRILFVVIVSAAVAAMIAIAMNQKQRFQLMEADERRQYLGGKLGGRLSDEQIDRIAAAVSARLDAARPTLEPEAVGQPEPDTQPDSEGDEIEAGAADSD
jgi:hypothetical protein